MTKKSGLGSIQLLQNSCSPSRSFRSRPFTGLHVSEMVARKRQFVRHRAKQGNTQRHVSVLDTNTSHRQECLGRKEKQGKGNERFVTRDRSFVAKLGQSGQVHCVLQLDGI